DLRLLKIGAFNGQVVAVGKAMLTEPPEFALGLSADSIDLQQALESQKAKAADMVRGLLTGQAQVSGKGAKFDDIKPTLQGNGRANVKNGKLIGVNVASTGLKKVQNLPEIGDLVPEDIVKRHPELFNNPDTDIQAMSLTFQLQGPRLTTHDLNVQTQDYSLLGNGWF